jgi:predicted HTH domain antitoxin
MSSDQEIIKDLYAKVNNVNKEISDIKIILAKQEVILDEHIRRTELAEKAIEKNEIAVNKAIDLNTIALKEMRKELNDEISPLKTEMTKVAGMIKLLGAIVVIISLGLQIANFFIK